MSIASPSTATFTGLNRREICFAPAKTSLLGELRPVPDGEFARCDHSRVCQGFESFVAPLCRFYNPSSDMTSGFMLLADRKIAARTIQRQFHVGQNARIEVVLGHGTPVRILQMNCEWLGQFRTDLPSTCDKVVPLWRVLSQPRQTRLCVPRATCRFALSAGTSSAIWSATAFMFRSRRVNGIF